MKNKIVVFGLMMLGWTVASAFAATESRECILEKPANTVLIISRDKETFEYQFSLKDSLGKKATQSLQALKSPSWGEFDEIFTMQANKGSYFNKKTKIRIVIVGDIGNDLATVYFRKDWRYAESYDTTCTDWQ